MTARLKVALWSPLPPSPSGIADYVAETLLPLSQRFDLTAVVERPDDRRVPVGWAGRVCPPHRVGEIDLDLYHLGNSPAHAYVYDAAMRRPGVVVMHEWNLQHLYLFQTVERGLTTPYLREMRRTHGEAGSLVARQIALGLGGQMLPAVFALNEQLVEPNLAAIALTASTCAKLAARWPDKPCLHLPHHLHLALDPVPDRSSARAALGIAENARLLVLPGLATENKRIETAMRVAAHLREHDDRVVIALAGGADPTLPLDRWRAAYRLEKGFLNLGRLSDEDFVRALVAADVILALRFPSYGEISGALIRALGVGRPVIVTAGTPAAEEFPEGVVLPIDPGVHEQAELQAVLTELLAHPEECLRIGDNARAYVTARHDLSRTLDILQAFLERIFVDKERLLGDLQKRRIQAGGLAGYLLDELRSSVRELGLGDYPIGLEDTLEEMVGGPRGRA
ncbi:MAG: glycosyltransferase family 4 protein [Vicinamibacteria bacterium]|jgi:glycosyltransferase involved in cell wall biosynthesis|nr:glycosyltransferase family 4 protein [Vicinamibacteria bacterium]